MATATRTRTTRKAVSGRRPAKAASQRFDGGPQGDWYEIPSKGQLFAMAIAVFNGADAPTKDEWTRIGAKEFLTQAKEDGHLD